MASLSPSLSLNATLSRLEFASRKTPNASLLLDKAQISAEPLSLNRREALSVLRDATPVESAVYVPLLQECSASRSLPGLKGLHGHIVKTGAREDVFLSTFLVHAYGKCGDMDYARNLFDLLPRRNIVTWTALMMGYVHNSQPDEAAKLFLDLLEAGVFPTGHTFGAILSACSSLRDLNLGKQVHGFGIKYAVNEVETSIGNSLSAFYSKCGSLKCAVKAFQATAEKNVISWTSIISGCSDNGAAELGLRFFLGMLESGVQPNEFTLTSALSLCCETQEFLLGFQIQSSCIKSGCESKLPVRNSIMYLYLKYGDMDTAKMLFRSMGTASVVTWNAMMAGHAQAMDLAGDDVSAYRCGIEALKLFQSLSRSGLKPDLFSYSSALTVCGRLSALEQGAQVHALTIKSGFLSDLVVGSALVSMYSRCGSVEKACKAFVEMPMRTLISWTSMITAYSQHGLAREALQLFEDMRFAGVRPNEITFVAVLSACSQVGTLEEAKRYMKMMTQEYRIKPVMDHYACMVGLYVRLGLLDDAIGFIDRMPYEPNEVIWSMLIAGCRSQGNMDLAFFAADRLLQCKIKSAETYVLLLGMYISAERWQDVSRVRKLMKQDRAKGIKDWSWVTLKGKVYSFGPDDRSHAQSTQMEELLESLLRRAADEIGYIRQSKPNLLDLTSEGEGDDQEGPMVIRYQSEQMAIAFVLMHTSEGTPVRVVKNVAMCRDSHGALKALSALTEREIIVRDSRQLHRFRDGKCSCRDLAAIL